MGLGFGVRVGAGVRGRAGVGVEARVGVRLGSGFDVSLHQMSIGRVMCELESGMCSMPLITISAWLYAAAVSSSRHICSARSG